jgi:hypothetical protein
MQHIPPLPPQPPNEARAFSDSDWLAKEKLARNKKIVVFCLLSVIGMALSAACASLAHIGPPALYLFVLAGGLAMAAFAVWYPEWFATTASHGFISFLSPNQGLAASEATYSHIQATAARGDIAGALKEYESVIAAEPAAVEARIQAAELYATTRTDVARAAALYNEVRRIDGVSAARDLYASQRLIDLYDGPLRQPSKSLTELRRIIDRHQGSREADFARSTLAKRRDEQTRAGAQ